MSKSVLIMNTPETCCDCQFCYELNEGIEAACTLIVNENTLEYKDLDDISYPQERPKWCPLKELPGEENVFSGNEFEDGFTFGWNACVREILGERK